MTYAPAPLGWSAERPQAVSPSLLTVAVAVVMLLIFSAGWHLPLFGEKADEAASGLLRVAFLPAYGLAFLLIMGRPWNMVRVTVRQPFLIILMVVVVASISWSIQPDVSIRRGFAVGCTTLAGLALASRFRWAELARLFAITYCFLIVASYLVSLALPSIGVMTEIFPGAWRGLWMEKNGLGGLMAFGACLLGAAALLNPDRAKLFTLFAGLAIGLVLLSQSKTALASLLLGMTALGFVWIVQRGPALGAAATWAGVTGALLLAMFVLLASDMLFEILGKDATLTGRTEIWTAAMRQIEQRPWQGYGYAAVWSDKSGWGPLAWIVNDAKFVPQHAHNSWLEQWLGIGLFGLIAWGLFYLQTMSLAVVAVYRERGAMLAFPFLVVFTLVSLTESIAVVYNDFRWVLFVSLAAKLAFSDRAQDEA
ncbi:O-antigen ligase family protein [Caulobacter vibrioides]|uniref:HfsC n=2 Tax=Caulobacter vibrioides TaxID=155892 RepID=Q9A5L8_CAUVC|nr:O-antigen ligase [Caulobacter vibrioides]YP_002517884.1 polysaccharide polymerase hfsC [Caulobacter vibrioides NA1000]AAK24400.1 HfsC [Caulobacter vibrioides CB15]ACL95976.1 polysaccharide polymerase hfsC [Caulobacter vibrioides NA1000]ATC29283.1 O-antigen ligase family protein [Caulobacter vibrioides]QXZ50794.1 O-antigen ligase family protein [Caulobacter vibrioides]